MLTTPERRISAANLTVPKKRSSDAAAPVAQAPSRPPAPDIQALFDDLRFLIDDCGPKFNQHVLVTMLIEECIRGGLNTASQIIGVLVHLGRNNKHVAMMLKEGTGLNPDAARWSRSADGVYSLLA